MDFDGTNLTNLTRNHFFDSPFSISAVTNLIAFTYVNFDQKDQVSINEIWTGTGDDGFQQKIAEGIEWHYPVFSPDGEKIIFKENNDPIYIMNSDGKNLRRLTRDDGEVIHRYYSWSPVKFE